MDFYSREIQIMRQSQSKMALEYVTTVGVSVTFYGGELDGLSFSDPATVKKYARKSQLGEIFEFDRSTLQSDGVFRSSPRGWFTFGHLSFGSGIPSLSESGNPPNFAKPKIVGHKSSSSIIPSLSESGHPRK